MTNAKRLMIGALAAVASTAAYGQWEEIAKLEAPDPMEFDWFGFFLAMSPDGSTVAITSDGNDDHGDDAGIVYVFERNDSGEFELLQTVFPNDPVLHYFGDGLAMTDDTIIAATTLPIGGGPSTGAAYIFERDEQGIWTQAQKTWPNGIQLGDNFAETIDMWEDRAIFAARHDDDNGSNAGAAYIFERDEDGIWNEAAKLLADDGAPGDGFSGGEGVAIHGDVAVVGAVFAKVPPDFDQDGKAYVFERSDGVWTQTQMFTLQEAGQDDRFGISVEVSEDTIAVGANKDDIEIDGELYEDVGSLSLFERNQDGDWVLAQQIYLTDLVDDPSEAVNRHFGTGVDIDGDRMIAGDGYLFTRSPGGRWSLQQQLKADEYDDGFGWLNGSAISGDLVAAANPWVNNDTGVAYVFEYDDCMADFNDDGALNVLDFVAYQTAWTSKEAEADCNVDNDYNILDFVCFQSAFQAGCD